MKDQLKQISKLLSYVLRHKPESIGLQLDENGWADVTDLIEKIIASGTVVDFETIDTVVQTNDKKRFAFNDDKTKIRASQGHSIDIDLNLSVAIPPAILFHGTADRFLSNILKDGLQKQQRQHVHLSALQETAKAVGSRHGKPVFLKVNTVAMLSAGFTFYFSDNGVWLVNDVPRQYLALDEQS